MFYLSNIYIRIYTSVETQQSSYNILFIYNTSVGLSLETFKKDINYPMSCKNYDNLQGKYKKETHASSPKFKITLHCLEIKHVLQVYIYLMYSRCIST